MILEAKITGTASGWTGSASTYIYVVFYRGSTKIDCGFAG